MVKILGWAKNPLVIFGGDFFVRIEWMGRKMGVPLSQLKPLKVEKETKQAVEDWQYWKARGYQF